MKILVPVESEKIARAQLDFISNHKWPDDLAFHIVFAIEPVFDDEPKNEDESLHRQLVEWKKERGLRLVSSVAAELRKTFRHADILETVETDHPSELILDVEDEWKADLIVIGAHGRTMPARLLIGSVSTAILAHASCSVMVVRPARELHRDAKEELESTVANLR